MYNAESIELVTEYLLPDDELGGIGSVEAVHTIRAHDPVLQ